VNRQGGREGWLRLCLNEIKQMPPKKSNTLTEAELRLMKILWRRGESAVTDLVAAMPEGEALAYNSVLTTIRILEQKGYVEHRQEGRAFVYRPCVLEHEASRSEVRHVMSRFFGNSREQLLLTLLGDEEISAGELERLKEVIRNAAPDADAAALTEPVRPAHHGLGRNRKEKV
jgi:predicted transcriptional regulator